MTKKSLLFIGALALSTISIASAKSYDVVLSKAVRAGASQLAAGRYTLAVKGSSAIFTNVETNHSFVSPVTVQKTDRHDATAVELTTEGSEQHVTSIDLGGSNETIQFGE
jgi:hypothetical protein